MEARPAIICLSGRQIGDELIGNGISDGLSLHLIFIQSFRQSVVFSAAGVPVVPVSDIDSDLVSIHASGLVSVLVVFFLFVLLLVLVT